MRDRETQQLFWVWWAMRARCENPSDPSFVNYGGRGITVCPEWSDFKAFLADMGPREPGMTLDRIDNEKGYSAANCRWATRQEQNSNRRNCILVEVEGETVTLKEACRRCRLPYRPVHKRIVARGWDVQKALSTPIGKGNSHANY